MIRIDVLQRIEGHIQPDLQSFFDNLQL